jgi:Polyketide cyclase / dehydrase and lipid transport
MRAVRVQDTFPGSLAEVERRWYDTHGWAGWVDGLDRVVDVAPAWPAPGAVVRWESGPAGRGHVTERVLEYQPGAGQTVEVHDVSVSGRQSVAFAPVTDGVEVTVLLEYRLHRRSPVTPLVDVLFIRRAMAQSLSRTLDRFGARLRDDARITDTPSA